MENYGRNGKQDFKVVTGKQWTAAPGVELYQVPMFETSGDPQAVQISAKDAGTFSVDPSYQYQAVRGKGVDIVFNYKHLGINEPEVMMGASFYYSHIIFFASRKLSRRDNIRDRECNKNSWNNDESCPNITIGFSASTLLLCFG